MAFETTRTSRSAIVAESTEGTPISPSAGTDFVALQEGFEISPNFEMLESAELSGTSGMSAPVQGVPSPEASSSHYLRGSGTEGVAPNYSLYLESLFGASSKSVNSTERLTTTGSTTSTVELASGGTDFSKGKAILLKDSQGYSVRNVYSVATNSLTLAHNLGVAPGSGVACGKCINFTPTETIKSFSLWNYLANGGAIQLVPGAKTASATMNFPAGQPINADYSFIGTDYYFDPIEAKATSCKIDFKIDGGGELTATLTNKVYKDPAELASEVQSKMDALAGADDITCTYSSATGKFTIAITGATSLDLLWSTGTNAANSAKSILGYASSDDTGALTYTSDTAINLASPFTPVIDSEPFLVAKANELLVGDATDSSCLAADSVTVNFSKESSPINSICETSGKVGDIFNSRSVTIDVVAYLQKYDISKWLKFKNNDTVRFAYNAGRKSNNMWVAGSVVNLFSPTAKVSSINFSDLNGVVAMNLTLTCFCDSANPEFYMNYL